MCASKTTYRIHLLIPINRQTFSHFQENGFITHLLCGKINAVTLNAPLTSVSLNSMPLDGMEYPSPQLRPAVPAAFPPWLLSTRSLFAGRVEWETEKALMLCKHSSATTKIADLSIGVLVTNPDQHLTDCYEENYLHPSHSS